MHKVKIKGDSVDTETVHVLQYLELIQITQKSFISWYVLRPSTVRHM